RGRCRLRVRLGRRAERRCGRSRSRARARLRRRPAPRGSPPSLRRPRARTCRSSSRRSGRRRPRRRGYRAWAGLWQEEGRRAPEYTCLMVVVESSERNQDLVDELIRDVEAYIADADRELLTRAFHFAARAHEGQQRRSGEDFIEHPFGVAKICAELHLDEEAVAAALLHDVVEDTQTTIDEVRDACGPA